MTVGFIVEGSSEKIVVASDSFAEWLETCGISRGTPVIDARGNLSRDRIAELARLLRRQAGDIDGVVLLRDLDPDGSIQCITERRRESAAEGVDVVAIARKAIESWFLADSRAMQKWTKDATFLEPNPRGNLRDALGPSQGDRTAIRTGSRAYQSGVCQTTGEAWLQRCESCDTRELSECCVFCPGSLCPWASSEVDLSGPPVQAQYSPNTRPPGYRSSLATARFRAPTTI